MVKIWNEACKALALMLCEEHRCPQCGDDLVSNCYYVGGQEIPAGTMTIKPVLLADLAIGERYVFGEFDQVYRLSDALTVPGAELRGSAFSWPGETDGQSVMERVLTTREKWINKRRAPVDETPGVDEELWK